MSDDKSELGPDGKVIVPDHVADAVRTLIEWAGDDPAREGLLDTTRRVPRAWEEYCQGNNEDPSVTMSRTFDEVDGSADIMLLRELQYLTPSAKPSQPITAQR